MFVRIGRRDVDSDVFLDVIEDYNNNKDFISFKEYVNIKNYTLPSDIGVASKFILEYGTKEMHDKFMLRNYPLGRQNEMLTDEQIKIRNKVNELALKIVNGKANLIDIIDQVTIDINEFLYYLKHIRYTYKDISEGIFTQCRSYLETVKNYQKCTIMTVEFSSLSKEDRLTLINMLKTRKLPLNNITYSAIYDYARNHKLLKELGDNMNFTTEEKTELYNVIIGRYVNDDKIYDFGKFLESNSYPVTKQMNKVIKVAKKYVSEELYTAFINKVYPFGVKNEPCSKEQELLRNKVKLISEEVAYQNANIVDILENITTNLDLYLYYLKQSKHYYEDISAGVYQKVKEYIVENKHYDFEGEVTVKYKDITEEDDRIIRKLLDDKKLPVNTITYSAMREYAIAKGIINHGKLQKNNNKR